MNTIRKKCLDCYNSQRKKVRLGIVKKCTNFSYRFGRRPDKAVVDTIKKFYAENA